MGRFCNSLLITFRVVQLLLSIAVLGCSAYIIYEMYSLTSSVQTLEYAITNITNTSFQYVKSHSTSIDITQAEYNNATNVMNHTLMPVLNAVKGIPTREIIVAVTGLWSICVITYLLVANRKTSNPHMNKRWVRVILELLTFLLWIVGTVCAALLAIEYGVIVFAGGDETKVALTALKPLLEGLFKSLFHDDGFLRSMAIVNDLFVIGILCILAAIAACICCVVSFISLIVACCMSGKKRDKMSRNSNDAMEPFMSTVSGKNPGYSVVESSPEMRQQSTYYDPGHHNMSGYTVVGSSPELKQQSTYYDPGHHNQYGYNAV